MNYYQNYGSGGGGGGWGTKQFQFPAPMAPDFQPQPSWGGQDYFRAHAGSGSPDLSLYNQAWGRVAGMGSDTMGEFGVGLHEARHWHQRAYGGVGNASQMQPSEIGHAAAYEAYRTWIHNSSIYEPLSGDVGRQREGLTGLAIAEASRLLQFTGRGRDSYARVQAAESAAATASIIFGQSRNMDGMDGMDGGYRSGRSHSRSRSGSFSGYGGAAPYRSGSPFGGSMGGGSMGGSPSMMGGGYAGSMSGSMGGGGGGFDPYEFDNSLMSPRRHRHRSRSRSRHRHGTPSPTIVVAPQMGGGQYPPVGGAYGASPMAIQGGGSPYAGAGGYGGGGGSYGAPGGGYGQAPMPIYAPTAGSYGAPGVGMGGYPGSGSMGMPAALPVGSTMIVPSSRSRRHSHGGNHHHHHRRPRSADGYRTQAGYGGGYGGGAQPMGVPGMPMQGSAMGSYRY